MKENSCSHKLRYEGYLKLICRCLSDDMYIKLTHVRISYRVISCVYGKSHIKVVSVIFKLEITKLSYIGSVIF
jgi:hypothetical protein